MLVEKKFFTPGPSALYPTVSAHLNQALKDNVASISHRSNDFRAIYQDATESIANLFDLPPGFAVLFTGSATEIWEKILLNCVAETSMHFVNGAFSQRFYEFAQQLGKKAVCQEVPAGDGFAVESMEIHYKTELVALTHNETSTGVAMPLEDIYHVKDRNPKRLVALDMVSSAPYPNLDFNKIDTAYFSVQKAFGLPAGLGVWLVHEKCLSKAELLESKQCLTGAYHRLSTMWQGFEKYQTQATPNVLGIYLLGKVARDMLSKGIATIRAEIAERAKKLYAFFEDSADFEIFVKNPRFRSDTVIVANCLKQSSAEIVTKLEQQGLIIGQGYGAHKAKQIRIANFPAHSTEDFETLMQALKDLR